MPKERGVNPVQAQRKAEKAKAIKKGKAEVQAKRNERLAKRNPEGIKRQIDDLKAIASGGGKLTRHEEQVLEGLEKELKAVTKAREALGDSAPVFHERRGPPREGGDRGGRGGGGVLGKRRRGRDDASTDSDSDEVPEDVKSIPMPRDTPPPIPREVMDRWWARRRARRGGGGGGRGGGHGDDGGRGGGTNANLEPLANNRRPMGHIDSGMNGEGNASNKANKDDSRRQERRRPAPQPAAVEPKLVYEAKPIVRDLVKEAASAFVPAAVRTKLAKGKGEGGLIEPEEADRLEREGYLNTTAKAAKEQAPRKVALEEADDDDDD